MRIFLLAGLLVSSLHLPSQNTVSIDAVIDKIESLQVVDHDFYDSGLFHSTRYWMGAKGVDDNSVFPTASATYVLRELNQTLNNPQLQRVIKNAQLNFSKYRSRRGEPAFNMWQTTAPDLPFPNSNLLSKERYRLADDYDNTAIVQLAKGPNSLDDSVRLKMVNYALRNPRAEIHGFKDEYKTFSAYEVWYADKMDQEYDIVVMANVLLFAFQKGYPKNGTDEQTIALISQVVFDDAHLTDPGAVSPYYAKPSLILYHLARMMAKAPSGAFSDLREPLIEDIDRVLTSTENELERILLFNALHLLGEKRTADVLAQALRSEARDFIFFEYQPQASLLRVLPKMKWKCEAVNWAFILEFLTHYNGRINWQN